MNAKLAGLPKDPKCFVGAPAPVSPWVAGTVYLLKLAVFLTAPWLMAPSSAAQVLLDLEAESGALTAPMAVYTDPWASEGHYVASRTNNQGSVAYSFYAPVTGEYVIWCRVLATNVNADSFFVSANYGPEDIYDVAEGSPSSAWQWSPVNGRGGSNQPLAINPRIFSLSAGWNSLGFRAREAGTGLDRLLITTDLGFSPSTNLPVIHLQPQDQGVLRGNNATFTVVATGQTPLGYQWRFNERDLSDGPEIQGATTPTLVVSNAQPPRTGGYSVVVSNSCGVVVSRAAVLALRGFVQDAVNTAPAGSTVSLPAGIYWENAIVCKDLNLQGAGAASTIVDGNAAGSVFRICSNSTVSLGDLTIRNGRDPEGGGIWNAGTLTVTSVVITANVHEGFPVLGAAGIFNSGSILLRDSSVCDNINGQLGYVGGIYNTGTIQVVHSRINHNGVYGGVGGIINEGMMFLTDSTVENNSAWAPGGIENNGLMTFNNCSVAGNYSETIGGISNHGLLIFTNCTISGNSGYAETGGIGNSGRLLLESCTVYQNRSSWAVCGIDNFGGTVELHNTIITSNREVGLSANLAGTFVSLGHNLIGTNDPFPPNSVTFTLTGNTNGNILGLDPLLGPLQDNGGHTFTHALLPGSPAIDAGDNAGAPATDQRGYQRIRDANGDGNAVIDIGAFEIQGPPLRITSLADHGPGTLRQGLADALPGDTVEIVTEGTILLTSGELCIDRDMVLHGLGADRTFISGARLVISNEARVWMDDLAITGVYCDGHGYDGTGGGLRNLGHLTMNGCVVSNCVTEYGDGGAIYNESILSLNNCSIIRNSGLYGGGIANYGQRANLTMNNCTLARNVAGYGDGGAIMHANGADLFISNCTISQNGALTGQGGGIACYGEMTIDSSTICSNQAIAADMYSFGRGGGIFISTYAGSYKALSRNSIFAGNSADTAGPDYYGALVSGGYDLIQNPEACTITGETKGNILGRDPLLGPLQNNGGPTLTHALLPGSPAIDAGPTGDTLRQDQRGRKRPQDGDGDWVARYDIGAFEKEDVHRHRFVDVRITPEGNLRLQIQGVADRYYTIQATTRLSAPDWVWAFAGSPDATGSWVVVDTEWRSYPTRFYRVVEP